MQIEISAAQAKNLADWIERGLATEKVRERHPLGHGFLPVYAYSADEESSLISTPSWFTTPFHHLSVNVLGAAFVGKLGKTAEEAWEIYTTSIGVTMEYDQIPFCSGLMNFLGGLEPADCGQLLNVHKKKCAVEIIRLLRETA